MKQSVTRELYAYWTRTRGERSAPDHSDIDPLAIRELLADVFIIEVDPQRAYPIASCGTRLNALWLSEQRGKSFLELWQESDRRHVAATLLAVVDETTPLVIGAASHAPDLRPLGLELLLLPLRRFGNTHSRLLCSLAPTHEPLWFGRVPVKALGICSMRVIRESASAVANHSVPRNAAPATRGARKGPTLVVYMGGKSQSDSTNHRSSGQDG